MAYDEGLAELMRTDLADETGITERKMFGGLCFMKDGHMLCGVHRDGAMFRVGKAARDTAMAIPGAVPMAFTGRPMGGFIDVPDPSDLADDARRARWIEMALAHAKSLPPKS